MASTFAVTRNHLIFGICLPLALLLGYLLADAQDPMTFFFVAIFGTILTIPLMMQWYHPILIFAWNMNAAPAIPGRPYLWALVAFLAFIVVIINRAMTEQNRFPSIPRLTKPLVALLLVFILTAFASGGVGLSMLRSGTVGGKNYFYLVCAIAGFFVLGSRAIPAAKANLYLALFFLPGMLTISSTIATWISPAADFVFLLFSPDTELVEIAANPESVALDQVRWRGISTAATLVFLWFLARVGLRGIFDFYRPWRVIILLVLLFAGTLGGFRSVGISMLLVFAVLFYLEKLWRSKVMIVVVAGLLVAAAALAGFADKLPLSMQRTLSFLPVDIDPVVRQSAQTSSEWRLEMWREAWKQVPDYLFKGKGYTARADDMYMVNFAMLAGHAKNWEWALLSGDYHNGPLSLLIPFGVYGLLAFLWLLWAGGRYLYGIHKNSAPELQRLNTFLFAYFVVRGGFFLFVYGAIAHDLYIFTGILGFSVALNVTGRVKEESQPVQGLEAASPQS